MSYSEIVDINPATTTKTSTVTKIEITNITCVLFQSAACYVNIYDDNNIIVDSKYVTLTTEQYDAWGDDDQHFIDCVLLNLGYTRLVV